MALPSSAVQGGVAFWIAFKGGDAAPQHRFEELVGATARRLVEEGAGATREVADIRVLERKLAQLQASLREREVEVEALRARPAPSAAPAAAAAADDDDPGGERERLLGLLGKMDAERAELQRENAELARQVGAIGDAAGAAGAGGGQVSVEAFKRMQFVKEQLEAALEKAHRELTTTRTEMGILQGEYNALFENSDNEE